MDYPYPDKRCTRCGLLKPVSCFYKHSGKKYGINYICGYCARLAKRKSTANFSEEQKEARHVYMKKYMRAKLPELKKIVYDHYGNSCTKCAENNIHKLTIEHIGGVRSHYRHPSGKRKRGLNLFRLIIKENFPDYITVLCFNCNLGGYIEQISTPS